jgi:Phytanoyl-CoA dioxygenase (PhyH)
MTVTTAQTRTWAAMTDAQREQFDRDGFIILRGLLSSDEVSYYAGVLDRVYEEQKAAGKLSPEGSLHMLSAVTSAPELRGLIDHPAAFPLVWSILGWNAHIYHSHLDVHPGITVEKPFRWEWHQDGGRQNREIEVSPRPRLSVKLGFWLSDVSETGRGNLMVIPGSHKTDWLPGPPARTVEWPTPEGAIEVQVGPGDVIFFDRRIWHGRSNNYSDVTRKVVFVGYTYRWIAIRDDVAHLPQEPWWADTNPVQRQLLGGVGVGDGDHHWGHYPEDTPLYVALRDGGHLTNDYPPLIP